MHGEKPHTHIGDDSVTVTGNVQGGGGKGGKMSMKTPQKGVRPRKKEGRGKNCEKHRLPEVEIHGGGLWVSIIGM